MNRLIPALALLLLATQAKAADLTVPANTLLCRSLAGITSSSNPGCWVARSGQRVEIIAALSAASQVRIWSSDGSETMVAWAMRADAERMQRVAR